MILTWFLGGVAVGAVIYAIHTRRNLIEVREEYDKRCNELISALGEVGRSKLRIKSMQKSNADMVERISEYKHLMCSGCNNLKVKELDFSDVPLAPKYMIAVVGQDTINPDLDFAVKTFTADNEEDREFAIRQAEELIETIQNF